MQVDSQPRQASMCDCGLFAGLQAEVLCRNVMGEVTLQDGKLVCGGDNPTFLMNKDSWFTENDVFIARLLLRAAALAFWTHASPTPCSEMEADWRAAYADLQKAWRGPVPPRSKLWCVPTTFIMLYQTTSWRHPASCRPLTNNVCRDLARSSTIASRREYMKQGVADVVGVRQSRRQREVNTRNMSSVCGSDSVAAGLPSHGSAKGTKKRPGRGRNRGGGR